MLPLKITLWSLINTVHLTKKLWHYIGSIVYVFQNVRLRLGPFYIRMCVLPFEGLIN